MIVAFTGHRPPKGGLSYGGRGKTDVLLSVVLRLWLETVRPRLAICGGALGFDQLAAEAALSVQVPLLQALPFPGFDSRWPEASRRRLSEINRRASEVCYVHTRYTRSAYQDRNEFMVDRCDLLVAYWDGSRGGTFNCVRYAEDSGVPVLNVFTR